MSYSLRSLLQISVDSGVPFDTPLFCGESAIVSVNTNGRGLQLNAAGMFEEDPDKPLTLSDIVEWARNGGILFEMDGDGWLVADYDIFIAYSLGKNCGGSAEVYTLDMNKDRILFTEVGYYKIAGEE